MAEENKPQSSYNGDKNLNIKSWAEEDRPREKFLLKGKSALSDAELLAILIGSGTTSMSAVDLGKHILHKVGNDLNQLAKLSVKELMKFRGIGEAKAITIAAALELGRRRKDTGPNKKEQVIEPKDAYELMKPFLTDLQHEEFWLIFLNRGSFVIKKEQLSRGGIAGTVVDLKLIFQKAIENLASSIVLIHNHPSGNLMPSQHDKVITQRIKEAGHILEINLVDHIIFTDGGYYSFTENNIL